MPISARPATWFACFLLVTGLAAPEVRGQQARVHVIIVANRWDASIGGDMALNAKGIAEMFRTNVPRRNLTVEVVDRNAWTPRGVLDRIARAPVGPNDSLIVFAMGHGAFDPRSGSYLLLAGGQPLFRSQLRQAVEARGARLGALFTDHCNGPRKVEKMNGVQAPAPPPEAVEISPSFRALFFESRGFMELSACKPGEFALCLPSLLAQGFGRGRPEVYYRGSLFTQALMDSLQLGAFGDDGTPLRPSWRAVASDVGDRVKKDFDQVFPTGLRLGPGGGPQNTQTVVLLGEPPIDLRPAPPPAAPEAVSPNRLGVRVEPVGQGQDGVRIVEVVPGTPAAEDEFRVGDVLLTMGRSVLRTPGDLARALEAAGKQVVIAGYDAKGEEFARPFKLMEAVATNDHEVRKPPASSGPVLVEAFGAEVEAGPEGVIVRNVLPHTVAAAFDFVPGDLIRRVHEREVRSPDEFRKALAAAGATPMVRFAGTDPRGWDYDGMHDVASPRSSRLGVYMDNDTNGQGVILSKLMLHFPAADHGLKAGDVVRAINGERVANIQDAAAKMARSARTCKLLVWNAQTNRDEEHEIELCR